MGVADTATVADMVVAALAMVSAVTGLAAHRHRTVRGTIGHLTLCVSMVAMAWPALPVLGPPFWIVMLGSCAFWSARRASVDAPLVLDLVAMAVLMSVMAPAGAGAAVPTTPAQGHAHGSGSGWLPAPGLVVAVWLIVRVAVWAETRRQGERANRAQPRPSRVCATASEASMITAMVAMAW